MGLKCNLIQMNFVKDVEKDVNQHLKKKIEECLKMTNPGYDAKDSECFIELI